MKKRISKKTTFFLSIIVVVSFVVFSNWKEKVEISNIEWTVKDNRYLVTFIAENKSNSSLYGNISIRLHYRTHRDAGLKAVVTDLVGQKGLRVGLSPNETREFSEFVNPRNLSLKADIVIVNAWGFEKTDT